MVLALYLLSCGLHIASLGYGLACIKAGEHLFVTSCPTRFFSSRIEQKYWTVNLGVLSNILFLFVMPLYLASRGFDAVQWLNPPFSAFHAMDAFITLLWHRFTLLDIRSGRLARYDTC